MRLIHEAASWEWLKQTAHVFIQKVSKFAGHNTANFGISQRDLWDISLLPHLTSYPQMSPISKHQIVSSGISYHGPFTGLFSPAWVDSPIIALPFALA
jgi:hypothetical protein